MKCECGKTINSRKKFGPTGRKCWMVFLIDCWECGRHYLIPEKEYTEEQKNWVERWNKRIGNDGNERQKN